VVSYSREVFIAFSCISHLGITWSTVSS
jgi:hypothetical protein